MPRLTDYDIQKRMEEIEQEVSSQDIEVRHKAGRDARSLYRTLRLLLTELTELEGSGDINREARITYLLTLVARLHRISAKI